MKVEHVQVGAATVEAATVEYDPSTTSDARIREAVEEQGYAVRSTAA